MGYDRFARNWYNTFNIQDFKAHDKLPSADSTSVYNSQSELLSNDDINGTKGPQYMAGLIATFSVVTMGTTLAWTSQISETILDGGLGFPVSLDELGWIGSLMALGAASLSLFSGMICDFMGRKTSMLILILPVTVGWCLIIWAQSVSMVYAGRILTGMVAGGYCVMAAIYNSEIVQKDIRGALGSSVQLMISTGILFTNVMAKFLSITHFTIACACIPILFGVMFIFMPESPYYLLMKKRNTQARAVLVRLRGVNFDVDKELKEMETGIWEKHSTNAWSTIGNSLKKKSTKWACVIGFSLMLYKTTNGVDAISAYTTTIFVGADTGIDPQIGTIIINVFQVGSAIFQSMVVDRTGRRVLLIVSGIVMAVCLVIVGLVFSLTKRGLIDEEYFIYVNYLPLIALVVFIVAFSFGLGPIPWLMLGEIFPPEIKSYAASTATFLSKISSFGVTKVYLTIGAAWGEDVPFYIFALITISSVFFTFFLVPETKNKSFDEIQESLG